MEESVSAAPFVRDIRRYVGLGCDQRPEGPGVGPDAAASETVLAHALSQTEDSVAVFSAKLKSEDSVSQANAPLQLEFIC